MSIYLSMYLSIYLSIYPSSCVYIYMYICIYRHRGYNSVGCIVEGYTYRFPKINWPVGHAAFDQGFGPLTPSWVLRITTSNEPPSKEHALSSCTVPYLMPQFNFRQTSSGFCDGARSVYSTGPKHPSRSSESIPA